MMRAPNYPNFYIFQVAWMATIVYALRIPMYGSFTVQFLKRNYPLHLCTVIMHPMYGEVRSFADLKRYRFYLGFL